MALVRKMSASFEADFLLPNIYNQLECRDEREHICGSSKNLTRKLLLFKG